ncbi:MAG: stage 0 sporulation family protein [Chloroflexota bacterium]|nr:MAG: stage 0 sporulation family protein [Chloroflexota bacterium]
MDVQANIQTIVGIRFQKVGKIYHFDSNTCTDLKPGDFVVVETSRGRQLGEVVHFVEDPQPPPEGPWKPIQRKATPQDLVLRQVWHKKELEATIECRAKAAELRLEAVKIVASEFSFDGSRLSFLFSSEAGDKQDLRGLRRVMQRIYPQSKVEMHQIGPRDVAKILGGMGACGLENRCCSMFLTDFSPVSIKMAKEQGISLTPSEITGMCGRLRCCLIYEYEQYVEARKELPKRGKRVITPLGEGKVVDVLPLKQAVYVELDTGVQHEFLKHEIQPWDELEALKQKAQAPCDRHEGGECDCGKNKPAAQENGADANEQEAGAREAGAGAIQGPEAKRNEGRPPEGKPREGRGKDRDRGKKR